MPEKRSDYWVVIPSFDRPEILCSTTLGLLRLHGVEMNRVAVFVSPETIEANGDPEWYRYTRTLKDRGFGEVNVVPGGRGLEVQMERAMEWVGHGYMIVMSDYVKSVMALDSSLPGSTRVRSVPAGTLPLLWEHAAEMLEATGHRAWSVNPSSRYSCLRENMISRRLGLLNGNMMGILLPDDWRQWKVTAGHGLIYDVEFSAALWESGYMFFRYMGICCDHPYRGRGGQATLMRNAKARRKIENRALKAVAKKYPKCIKWYLKPRASLKVMQYKFLVDGFPPLTMQRRFSAGRPRKYHVTASASTAERVRRCRAKK